LASNVRVGSPTTLIGDVLAVRRAVESAPVAFSKTSSQHDRDFADVLTEPENTRHGAFRECRPPERQCLLSDPPVVIIRPIAGFHLLKCFVPVQRLPSFIPS